MRCASISDGDYWSAFATNFPKLIRSMLLKTVPDAMASISFWCMRVKLKIRRKRNLCILSWRKKKKFIFSHERYIFWFCGIILLNLLIFMIKINFGQEIRQNCYKITNWFNKKGVPCFFRIALPWIWNLEKNTFQIFSFTINIGLSIGIHRNNWIIKLWGVVNIKSITYFYANERHTKSG